MEDVVRNVGSVENWCEKYGAELGHEVARSAQVARVIMFGCGRRLAVWGATTVPRDIHGTWWIAFAAEYGLDLETYRCLSIHCESFREDVWAPARKVRFSQHKMEVVEKDIKVLRFLRFVDAVDRKVAAAGEAAPDAGAAGGLVRPLRMRRWAGATGQP